MAIKVSVGGNTAKAVKVSVASSNPRLVSTVATGSKRVTSAKVEQLANVDITAGI